MKGHVNENMRDATGAMIMARERRAKDRATTRKQHMKEAISGLTTPQKTSLTTREGGVNDTKKTQ